MNPYTVLDINKDASESEIKKAYRKMARIQHCLRLTISFERNLKFARFLFMSLCFYNKNCKN